jgi:hypothetical protein
MSIASKTQEKKLEREISLAQRIEPERRMKWSNTDISFGLEYHPETEMPNWNLLSHLVLRPKSDAHHMYAQE